jgi:hypothetical protein
MWFNNISNLNASGFGVLKVIFEVNLKLFGKNPKKTILVAVRDFFEKGNNLKANTEKLTADFKKLFTNIENKPENLKDSKFEDFFELEFLFLEPANHENLAEKFNVKARELRERFSLDSKKPIFPKDAG